MNEFVHSPDSIRRLNPEFVNEHIDEFVSLANLIPKVEYTSEEILADVKPDGRKLRAKWNHSYASIAEDGTIVGFVMAYEREAENNLNYPSNTLYISELAVRPEFQGQGHAKKLIKKLISDTEQAGGFFELKGPLNFSLQTNSAEWNKPIRDFYALFGFEVVGQKQYANRTDVVMRSIKPRLQTSNDSG